MIRICYLMMRICYLMMRICVICYQVDDDQQNQNEFRTPICHEIKRGRKSRTSSPHGRLWKEVMVEDFTRIRQTLALGSEK